FLAPPLRKVYELGRQMGRRRARVAKGLPPERTPVGGGELIFSAEATTAKAVEATAKYVAAKIIRGSYTFADWTHDGLKQFGEAIRPHLKLTWDKAAA